MNNEWRVLAKFEKIGDYIFRTETYLQYGSIESKEVIGTIIMLNPGSSRPNREVYGKLCLSCLDPTMRIIGKMVLESYAKAGSTIQSGICIEIVNLFNLCQAKSDKALAMYDKLRGDEVYKKWLYPDCKIKHSPLFVWKAWGRICDDHVLIMERKWDRLLNGSRLVGEDKRYHPIYLNINSFERAKIVEQIRMFLSHLARCGERVGDGM